ncbi:MAG: alginate export family protein [Pseudomonadota bacterium]
MLVALLGAVIIVVGWSTSALAQDSESWRPFLELRERFSYLNAFDFDATSPDADALWAQRLHVGADYESEGPLSARGVLVSAINRGGQVNPVERNNLDIQEAWLRYSNDNWSATLGRQQLKLGSQRLVALRLGTNVVRTWDGLRISGNHGGWRWDLFGLQLVQVEPNGSFNDESDGGRTLAGLYATRGTATLGADFYYLYARFDQRRTIEGVADQDRHTVGARLFGERGPWFWNWEAMYQFGEQDLGAQEQDIRAWSLATNTGYRFSAPWSPAVMLSVNVASGDEQRGDGRLETFDALYPRGNYFSELAQLGPSNFVNVNPYLMLEPSERLSLSFDVNLYWRREEADGVYGPPGNIIRAPLGSTARFVNTAFSASAEWALSKNYQLGLALTRSRPERFIEETGPSDSTNFIEFTFEAGF